MNTGTAKLPPSGQMLSAAQPVITAPQPAITAPNPIYDQMHWAVKDRPTITESNPGLEEAAVTRAITSTVQEAAPSDNESTGRRKPRYLKALILKGDDLGKLLSENGRLREEQTRLEGILGYAYK